MRIEIDRNGCRSILIKSESFNKIVLITMFIIFTFYMQVQCQTSDLDFSGYIKGTQMIYCPSTERNWWVDNTITNRLNLKWFPSESISFDLQARNRFIYGDFVKSIPDYRQMVVNRFSKFNWYKVISEDSSYILLTELDRANLKFSINKFEITLGRQRINWGTAFVWNPNDIYNTYNYFDFDYPERPGSDAVKIQYYFDAVSSLQLAAKYDDSFDRMALAGRASFSLLEYDLHISAGKMADDLFMGFAWAGQIAGGGFRGEASYFKPTTGDPTDPEALVATIEGDYTLPNSLYLHLAGLYNSCGTTGNAGQQSPMFIGRELSPKSLSPARFSVFTEIAYQLTSLTRIDLSSMLNPSDMSAFIMPSLDCSVGDNLNFTVMWIHFTGNSGSEFGDYGNLFLLRLQMWF